MGRRENIGFAHRHVIMQVIMTSNVKERREIMIAARGTTHGVRGFPKRTFTSHISKRSGTTYGI